MHKSKIYCTSFLKTVRTNKKRYARIFLQFISERVQRCIKVNIFLPYAINFIFRSVITIIFIISHSRTSHGSCHLNPRNMLNNKEERP